MMWMPLRSVKMYGFIFGFHRLAWCPKWTPASSSARSVACGERPWVLVTACCTRSSDRMVLCVRAAHPKLGPEATCSRHTLLSPGACEMKARRMQDRARVYHDLMPRFLPAG